MQATVTILRPDSLRPDSTTDVSLRIESGEETAYHIDSVRLSPTWDPGAEREFPLDRTLFPGTDRYVGLDGIAVPPAIGGRQGFSVGFEVSHYLDDGTNYYLVRTEPLRLPVVDAPALEAVAYVPGDETAADPISTVLTNWGIEIGERHADASDVERRLRSPGDTAVFVAVVGDPTAPELGELVSVALDNEVWPLVFHDAPGEFEHPRLGESFVFAVGRATEADVEAAVAATLRTVRHVETGGDPASVPERVESGECPFEK